MFSRIITGRGIIKVQVWPQLLRNNSLIKSFTSTVINHQSVIPIDEPQKAASESSRNPKPKVPKANKMPSRPKISESDINEKFIKGGSGKGGQKINKTNSKVQLTHIPTGIVITSQATRSRSQNRKIAREILALKIEDMEKGSESRKQKVIARQQMVKQRAKKKTKAKYRKLEDEKKRLAEAQSSAIIDDNAEDEEFIIIEEDDEIVEGHSTKIK